MDLVFDAPPLVDWWPDHVRRCEITRVSLAVQLTVEVAPELPERPPPAANETPPPPPPPEVTRLAWEFDDETFRTRFLCGLAP